MPKKNAVAQRMKSIRLRFKMSQDAISAEFGLSVRFWRDRELGKEFPPRWMYYALLGFVQERAKNRAKKLKNKV